MDASEHVVQAETASVQYGFMPTAVAEARDDSLWPLFENASDSVLAVDTAGRIIRANRAACRLIGPSLGLGEHVKNVFASGFELSALLHDESQTKATLELASGLGHRECQVSVAYEPRERVSYWLVVCGRTGAARDQKIYYRATRDHLTGLYNRSVFQEELERRLGEAIRVEQTGALLWMDLDRFKQVNDSLGHNSGDLMLTMVAAFLQTNVRSNELLARVGGDEFGLVIPNGDEQSATKAARRIVREFQRGCFSIEGHSLDIGISIGVVVFPTGGTTIPEIMANADAAMYKAKAGGLGFVIHDPQAVAK